MSDTPSPSGERCPAMDPHTGMTQQCGLQAGHDGDHTLLTPSGVPWFGMPVGEPKSDPTPSGERERLIEREIAIARKEMNYAVGLHTAVSEEYDDRYQTALRNAWEALNALLSLRPAPSLSERASGPVNTVCVCSIHNVEYYDGCPRCALIGAEAIARTRAPAPECPQCEAVSDMAAKLVGNACDRHMRQIADMGFVEFHAAHPLGCHWCDLEKLEARAPAPPGEREALIEALRAGASQLRSSASRFDEARFPGFADEQRKKAALLDTAALSTGDPAEREPGERDRHGYLPCHRCGADCGMDAVVPDEVWEKISPSGDEGGMLCLWCMDALCVERGIEGPVSVKLYYPGRVLLSASYAPPEQGRVDLQARYREALLEEYAKGARLVDRINTFSGGPSDEREKGKIWGSFSLAERLLRNTFGMSHDEIREAARTALQETQR